MCILCAQWELEKLTNNEALRALGEMINTSKDKDQQLHLAELYEKILSEEVPLPEQNVDLEEDWWNATHDEE